MKIPQFIAALTVALQQGFNVLVKSAPGHAKSDIIAQTVASLGWDLLICHPVVSEPTDFKGLPGIVAGKADFLPYGNLRAMMEATKPLVVFLDDLGQAAPSVQAACMQLLLAREIDGKKLSKHVRFVAATNSRKDGAGVNGLLTPLLSRFALIAELELDAQAWRAWALANGMPVELVAFIGFKPDRLSTFTASREIENFACPRTIANLGRWLKAGVTDLDVWKGAVGEAFAIEFAAFHRTYLKLAGWPSEVVLNPAGARLPLPSEPDVMFALCGALAHNATRKNFASIAQYGARLPKEFQTVLMRDTVIRHPDLTQSKEYADWQTLNSDSIK